MKVSLQQTAEQLQAKPARAVTCFWFAWAVWTLLIVATGLFDSLTVRIISIVLPLIAAEIGIRVLMLLVYGRRYYYSLFSYLMVDHPVYGYTFRANTNFRSLPFLVFDRSGFRAGKTRLLDFVENRSQRNEFHVNALGFRGPKFDPQQKRGRLRIFCSGGSTTAGDYVDDHETWPAQLESKLRSEGLEVEVINAGVQGWYSYQERLRFEGEIIDYAPDIVLFHQGWNDEFEYSSLSLGKWWKEGVVRNVLEANNLYIPPNRWLSSRDSLLQYLTFQSIAKDLFFKKKMRFDNPDRWRMLITATYLDAWFRNLEHMARTARASNVALYTVNYPCLVSVNDTPADRQFYVSNSRITDLYAEYQAISKQRIRHTLQKCAPMIPLLDVQSAFDDIRSQARLNLFHDEIHMSAAGNQILAEKIGDRLMADPGFKRRYDGANTSNVDLANDLVEKISAEVGQNADYIDRMLSARIIQLSRAQQQKDWKSIALHIPDDRYTTF